MWALRQLIKLELPAQMQQDESLPTQISFSPRVWIYTTGTEQELVQQL